MAANQTLEVSLIGKNIALRYTDADNGTKNWEYHPVCRIVSITGQVNIGFGARDPQTLQRANRYRWDDVLRVHVELDGPHQPDIDFDLNQVTNQAGWTLDEAGVQQAIADISTWADTCNNPSGGPAGGATEATLLNVLAATDNHKDFEMKLIKDTGAANVIVKEIKTYDQDTGATATTYEDAAGAPYAPVGPLVYMDPESVLNLVNANLTPTTFVHTPVIAVGAGSIPIGARRGSVLNTGAVAGTWGGVSIPAGVGVPFGGGGLNGTLSAAIAYDATGTTFVIEYDV